jgi:hypothetical protein
MNSSCWTTANPSLELGSNRYVILLSLRNGGTTFLGYFNDDDDDDDDDEDDDDDDDDDDDNLFVWLRAWQHLNIWLEASTKIRYTKYNNEETNTLKILKDPHRWNTKYIKDANFPTNGTGNRNMSGRGTDLEDMMKSRCKRGLWLS